MSAARERILKRVRTAVTSRERTAHPGPLVAADDVANDPGAGPGAQPVFRARASRDRALRFMAAFRANGGEAVRFASMAEARPWLDEFVTSFAGVAVSTRVPEDLVPLTAVLAPERAALGISLATGAAAATGTLLLDSGEGRRLQLLPPTHLVWIRERDIAGTLGEALSRIRASRGGRLPAAIGLHSAPSKSADIGRVLVVGVHGPGRVIAAILEEGDAP
jgi:L-lactate dehydrogenase complex protein LldG